MADDSIRSTTTLIERFGSLRIACTRCGHSLLAGPDRLSEMFPRMMMLDRVRYRLRCRACGGRMPRVEVLPKPPRNCGDLS